MYYLHRRFGIFLQPSPFFGAGWRGFFFLEESEGLNKHPSYPDKQSEYEGCDNYSAGNNNVRLIHILCIYRLYQACLNIASTFFTIGAMS